MFAASRTHGGDVLHAQCGSSTSIKRTRPHDARIDGMFRDGVHCDGGSLVRRRSVYAGRGARRPGSAWYRSASASARSPATAIALHGQRADG